MATCDPLDFVQPVQSESDCKKKDAICFVARKCKQAVSRAASSGSLKRSNSGKKNQTTSTRDIDVPGVMFMIFLIVIFDFSRSTFV